MPRFRLLHGSHVQANPDGLERMSLKLLRAKAKENDVEGGDQLSKMELVEALRQPGEHAEIYHYASAQERPVFTEDDPIAAQQLMQDKGKFQCLDGELDPTFNLGPITQEEIARRGLANTVRQGDNLDSQTIAELRKFADSEEIDLDGPDGKPLTRKEDIIKAIRNATVSV